MKLKLRSLPGCLILITTMIILVAPVMAQQSQTAKSAKKGAGWGALAGLVFGGSLWDVAEGAAIGAAGGAGYGALKANEQQKRNRTDIAYAESQQRIRLEQKRAELEGQAQVANQSNWMADRDLLNRAFGRDNVDGLFALRDCQHEKAALFALAGANSDMLSHRLAAIWLEAIIAEDKRDGAGAKRAYQQIVVQDQTVVNIEQAQAETIDALVDTNGDEFEGGFVDGKMQGWGSWRSADGSRFEGQFKDGKPNGQGIYRAPNGDIFNGSFVDGLADGEISVTTADGQQSTQVWSNGEQAE